MSCWRNDGTGNNNNNNILLFHNCPQRGIVTLVGNFVKSQKVSSHQLNFKTYDLILLFKTIWMYWNCFLSPVATDGMDGKRLPAVPLLLKNSYGKWAWLYAWYTRGEWRSHEPQVVKSEDEQKERLHWFHITIWMPGTLVTEYFDWLANDWWQVSVIDIAVNKRIQYGWDHATCMRSEIGDNQG